ncbi:hypothetical protein RRG08_030927 [Elysia crispata]|uniref:Uncharacterized protein n=1 Tax=Elysia crispata TaxID=231223 RepID=A0AAE1ABW5_9GAST|nr:hypothetical protein RRG08_030927 [Elysia crispata]
MQQCADTEDGKCKECWAFALSEDTPVESHSSARTHVAAIILLFLNDRKRFENTIEINNPSTISRYDSDSRYLGNKINLILRSRSTTPLRFLGEIFMCSTESPDKVTGSLANSWRDCATDLRLLVSNLAVVAAAAVSVVVEDTMVVVVVVVVGMLAHRGRGGDPTNHNEAAPCGEGRKAPSAPKVVTLNRSEAFGSSRPWP